MDYFHQWHWFVFAFNRSIKLSQACKKLIMPTTIAHSAIAVGLGPSFLRAGVKPRFWILGAIYAALPDFDTLGFRPGIPYAHFFGHRGFTHALTFPLVLAGLAAAVIAFQKGSQFLWPIMIYLFLCTGSHGMLAAMTNGGLGVALFSPFSDQRIFFSWRPIEVSPFRHNKVYEFTKPQGSQERTSMGNITRSWCRYFRKPY